VVPSVYAIHRHIDRFNRFCTAQHTDSHTNKYTERQTTLHRGIGSNRPHLAVAAMLLHAKNKYNNNNSDNKYGYSQKAL